MSSLDSIPLFDRLHSSENVLIAGAGGGFDIYAGLPLALALIRQGKTVHLANWSFAELYDPDFWVAPGVAAVRGDSVGNDQYFPERTLARWLTAHDLERPVYAFAPTGVRPLRAAYTFLAAQLDLDAVVLIDGGTDIWLRGDEAGLGTPLEDITSLAALTHLDTIPTRLVASIGFGIDAHHGVNHTHVLQNLTARPRPAHPRRVLHPRRQRRSSRLPRRRQPRPDHHPRPTQHRQRPDRRRPPAAPPPTSNSPGAPPEPNCSSTHS